MVRIATEQDAAQLQMLNNEFNGEGETTLENIRASLTANRQEVVIVDEDQGELTGFVCVQLKKSFCYDAAQAVWNCRGNDRLCGGILPKALSAP